DELFAAVTKEAADVLDVPVVALQRYDADRMFTMVSIAGETSFTVGSRWPVEDEGLAGMILATGRPARKQDYTTMAGPLGGALRDRSEEHTSELQSLAYLVCRLLLEKKKNKQHNNTARNITYKT